MFGNILIRGSRPAAADAAARNPMAHGLIMVGNAGCDRALSPPQAVYRIRSLCSIGRDGFASGFSRRTVGAIGLQPLDVRLETNRVADSGQKIRDLASEISKLMGLEWNKDV